jgi:hypothetical protein
MSTERVVVRLKKKSRALAVVSRFEFSPPRFLYGPLSYDEDKDAGTGL